MPQPDAGGLDHGLAYDAIAAGRVDLMDVYSTDAKIGRYRLRVLEDDRDFFPKYDAVLLMRAALDPAPLQRLEGRIDEATMIALNAKVELDGMSFADAARGFVAGTSAAAAAAPRRDFMQRLFADDFGRLLGQHLLLVFGSLALALAVGLPLGIAAWRWRASAAPLLGAVAVLQTIPSLALLAFLIAVVGGIGFVPALLALFLYALLPIVRNTHAGLGGVSVGTGPGGALARSDAAAGAGARAAAAGGADDPGRRQDGRGDQRRHRDHGGVHRRRRASASASSPVWPSTTPRRCSPARCPRRCWRWSSRASSTLPSGAGGAAAATAAERRSDGLAVARPGRLRQSAPTKPTATIEG